MSGLPVVSSTYSPSAGNAPLSMTRKNQSDASRSNSAFPVIVQGINNIPCVSQAAEKMLRILEHFTRIKPSQPWGNHLKSLEDYLASPQLREIFELKKTKEEGKKTAATVRYKKPIETTEQLRTILKDVKKVVNRNSTLIPMLANALMKFSQLQGVPFIQRQKKLYDKSFANAIDVAIESQSKDDYGKVKERIRYAYLNKDDGNFQSALHEFTDHVLKKESVHSKAEAVKTIMKTLLPEDSKFFSADNCLEKIKNAGKEYCKKWSADFNALVSADKANDTIVRTIKKAEFNAGQYFNKNCLQNTLDKEDSPFQSVAKVEDIVLSQGYEDTIKNAVYGLTKDNIIETVQAFDSSLTESIGKGIRNFDLNNAIKLAECTDSQFDDLNKTFLDALNLHKNIQEELAVQVNVASEKLLPGDEGKQLRNTIKNELNAIQVNNRTALRKNNDERLIAIFNKILVKDIDTLADKVLARTNWKDKLRAIIPQWLKESLKIQGSSLAANSRIQDAVEKYRHTVIIAGRAIVQAHMEAARAEREDAQNAGTATKTEKQIRTDAIEKVRSFASGLPLIIKKAAESSKAKLIENPGIIKSLLKPFSSSSSNILNKVAAVLVGVGALVVTAAATSGIVMTGMILPLLVGGIAISIGVFILIPAYNKIFSERAEMQEIRASLQKRIKNAEKEGKCFLNDISNYVATYQL